MVLRIPDSGLQLESSEKSADVLPLQAFAFTLSDSIIEDLISCAQNGEDIKLSLGNVPVSASPLLLLLVCDGSKTVDYRKPYGWLLLLLARHV